jgi:carboxypeptidase Q
VAIGKGCWLGAALALAAAAQSTHAYGWLTELTDGIGPRLTGSAQAARAAEWAAARMREMGLANVRLEPWTLRSGWERGTASAELTAPFRLSLSVASYGWTGSTRGAVEAEVVAADGGNWAGKVVLLHEGQRLADVVKAAEKSGAVAVVARDRRPGMMLTHTGPVAFGAGDEPVAIPVLDIAEEQQKLLERLLASGKPVRLRIAVENRFRNGPVTAHNISGEIRGRERPDEVVVIAAHLDSWDLGTGAIDDGTGVAAMLGAAEAIARGPQPRRTVRLVLFTGEEQGLLGSRAWVRQRAAEMPNTVCALAVDWGAGPIRSLPVAGHEELKRDLAPVAEELHLELPDGFLTFTDAYSFTLAGVPGLAFYQRSPDYTTVGHSAADTLDKVDRATLERNAATVARAAFWIADRQERVGVWWAREEIPRRLAGERKLLEELGIWPFGK